MNNSEIHFCKECQNMTYLYLDEEQNLIHHCKACQQSEPFTGKDNCIYSVEFREYDNSEYINNNKYITHDVTLPKIENNDNIKCPNDECPTITGTKESSVTYIKYDLENMKYIYTCNHCSQKWKTN
jgi:DNA-directed RNA polymerase subunit M/transcription elongation factor TFIIS|tara:strand:+ start:37 stop:414 length:378 start_codon:yes stop_codon:yes gene_type:complete